MTGDRLVILKKSKIIDTCALGCSAASRLDSGNADSLFSGSQHVVYRSRTCCGQRMDSGPSIVAFNKEK